MNFGAYFRIVVSNLARSIPSGSIGTVTRLILVAENAGVVGYHRLLRYHIVPLFQIECHDMAQRLIGLGNQLNVLRTDVHVLLKKYGTDVFLHPFGLISRLPGHVPQNLLYPLPGISRIVHDDPAHRDAALPLRPAEDVQKQLLLVCKMIANHFLQREKALEWHSVVGNLLDKVTLRPLRGDDQISLVNQLSICLDDGIPMYIQLSGQLSLCRHLVARAELPR